LLATASSVQQISRDRWRRGRREGLDAISGDAFILVRQRAQFLLANEIVGIAERPVAGQFLDLDERGSELTMPPPIMAISIARLLANPCYRRSWGNRR